MEAVALFENLWNAGGSVQLGTERYLLFGDSERDWANRRFRRDKEVVLTR